MIEETREGGVHVLRLAHGKVNAMDVELVEALTGRIDELAGSAGAIVLTGRGPAFSAGVDLRRVVEGGADYGERYLPALSRMFESVFATPTPTVAAVNGWAIAGGCVLAAACDRRILAADAQIGATELQVGVPFPVAALEVLRYACGPHVEEVVLGAAMHGADDAMRLGLVHEVVEGERLLDRAMEVGRQLAALPSGAYRAVKQDLRAATLARIAVDSPARDPMVRDAWASPATLDSIRAHLERATRRG